VREENEKRGGCEAQQKKKRGVERGFQTFRIEIDPRYLYELTKGMLPAVGSTNSTPVKRRCEKSA